jgi:hypothetical protein
MSLRRFMVLIRGLGPNSATVTSLANRQYIGTPAGRGRLSRTPEESEQALGSFFGDKVN